MPTPDFVFDANIAPNSKDAQAAQAFITFLKTPAAAALIKAKGMSPG